MAKAARKPKPVPDQMFVAASILPGEMITMRQAYSPRDGGLVQRCISQTLYRCTSLNAMTAAMQTLRLYRPAGRGPKMWTGRKVSRSTHRYLKGWGNRTPGTKTVAMAQQADDIEEVLDHPVLTLLRDPDPYLPAADWFNLYFWFKEMTGKSFLYAGERLGTAPTSLYLMFPQFTRIQANRATMIGGYWYGRSTTDQFMMPSDDVEYHRHLPSPVHPNDGISWPQSVVLSGDMENAALQSEIARWNNGGNPGMVIEAGPGTTDPQIAQYEALLAQKIRGVNKTGVPLILRNAKIAQYGQKPIDMQYAQGMEQAEGQIRKSAEIPESMYEMGSSSLASANRADPQYMGGPILWRLTKAADDFNRLLSRFGIDLGDMWFCFDNPVAEDREALQKEVVALSDSGLYTRAQARAALGEEPDPNDPEPDVYRYHGVDTAASNKAGPAQTTSLQELMTGVTDGDFPSDNAKAAAAASMPQIPPEELSAIFDGLKVRPQPTVTQIAGLLPEAPKMGPPQETGADAVAKAVAAKMIADISTKSAELPGAPKKVDAELTSMQSRVQAWYQEAMTGAINDGGVVNVERYMPELARIMRESYARVIQAAGEDEAVSVSGSFTLAADPKAVAWAHENAAQQVVKISDTLMAKLQDAVTEGIANQQTIAQVQAQILEEAPDFSVNRAEVIARTETSQALNKGTALAGEANGATGRKWLLAGDPCPECEAIVAANPGPVPYDQAFVGTTVMEPPAHPNCRCSIVNFYPSEEPE